MPCIRLPGVHLLLGRGSLREPGNTCLIGHFGSPLCLDATFAHTFFLEGLFRSDDSRLDFLVTGGAVLFSEYAWGCDLGIGPRF